MALIARESWSPTQERILDIAERLVQTKGYNGFSYASISTELGITTASLHYHFPSKAGLGHALIQRYAERFFAALDAIDASAGDSFAKLQAYAAIYASVLNAGRFCLCGMLAAEHDTLPEPMRTAVLAFFDRNEVWLSDVFEDGRTKGSLQYGGPAQEAAHVLLCGLEGALLVARPYGDLKRFEAAAARLLGIFGPPSAAGD